MSKLQEKLPMTKKENSSKNTNKICIFLKYSSSSHDIIGYLKTFCLCIFLRCLSSAWTKCNPSPFKWDQTQLSMINTKLPTRLYVNKTLLHALKHPWKRFKFLFYCIINKQKMNNNTLMGKKLFLHLMNKKHKLYLKKFILTTYLFTTVFFNSLMLAFFHICIFFLGQ